MECVQRASLCGCQWARELQAREEDDGVQMFVRQHDTHNQIPHPDIIHKDRALDGEQQGMRHRAGT